MLKNDPIKQNASAKKHYQKNKAKMVARAALFKVVAIKRNQQFIWDYLEVHPCVDCGEPDRIVLTFDHRNQDDKVDEVSTMVRNACALARIGEEMSKCDVRCANCHMRRSANQLGWWKSKK
jgi:hypothetical protein